MPVETAADRLAFFNTSEFALTATYTPASGGTSTAIVGIFDSTSVSQELGQASVQTRQPTFMCRVTDLYDYGHEDDQLVITEDDLEDAGMDPEPAGTYLVKVIQPDGTGMATLLLEKQP